MSDYSINQEFTDWRWGIMPTALMVGAKIIEVRARGSYSFSVKNVQELEVQMPELDDLKSYLNAIMSLTVTEVIGELGAADSDIGQLTAVTAQAEQALQAKLEPKFSGLGLQLTAVRVEAIESI
jgi:membrane protease subunit (stomatin/prohibitin family)